MTIQPDTPDPSSQIAKTDDIKPEKRNTAAMILEAAWDLHTRELIVTRETIADVTGIKLTTVDDRLGVLVDEGRLKRVLRGVYEPVTVHPPARPMSKTILSDGIVMIEIGELVLHLTPREDRALASLQVGVSQEMQMIAERHQTNAVMAELALKVKALERQLAAVKAGSQQVDVQMDLKV